MKKSGIMISGLVALILIVMEGVAIIAGGYRTFSGIAKDREEAGEIREKIEKSQRKQKREQKEKAGEAEEQRYTDTYAEPYTEPVTEPYTEPYVRESEPEVEAKTNMVEVPDLLGRDTELSKIITEGLGLYYYDTWYYNDFYDYGTVVWQSLEAGRMVSPGTALCVNVSAGKEPYTEPVREEPIWEDESEETSPNVSPGYVDESRLCQLVSDYYYNHYGVRPPCVRVDSFEDNIVVVHLYEALSDHDATWDWYYIDPDTGETTNFMGEAFNIYTD